MQLRTVPFTIDAAAIAAGLLALMDEDERDRLRLGLLPAPLFDVLKRMLREKFLEKCSLSAIPENPLGIVALKDQYTAICRRVDGQHGCDVFDFRMTTLVEEATREIVLELYKIRALVV